MWYKEPDIAPSDRADVTWKRKTYRFVFRGLEGLGLHLTRNSYYSPIPDTRTLRAASFRDSIVGAGIDLPVATFRTLAKQVVSRFKPEYAAFPSSSDGTSHRYYLNNGMFGGVDAAVYYALVRSRRPSRIIEIGCGFSTRVAAEAIRANRAEDAAYTCELVAIEPYPDPSLRGGIPELTRLIEKPVQDVSLDEFRALGAGDVLFIDSSHVAKLGSDVVHEFLRVLPELRVGTIVHFHDIFLPYDYNARYVQEHLYFWNENYLLAAFLIHNAAFTVLWPAQFMHRDHPKLLEETFPFYDRSLHNPTSFWLRRTGD